MYKYFKELEEPDNFKSLLNKSYEGKVEDLFEYTWPKSWYITPNGYLYNSVGVTAHKEGNLVYPFKRVCKAIYKERDVIMILQVNQLKIHLIMRLMISLKVLL